MDYVKGMQQHQEQDIGRNDLVGALGALNKSVKNQPDIDKSLCTIEQIIARLNSGQYEVEAAAKRIGVGELNNEAGDQAPPPSTEEATVQARLHLIITELQEHLLRVKRTEQHLNGLY